ncbi:hypothetical protein [Ideonella sp. A 288]|uniref:hypothetical protein n=1 Tax=Ideonella sp. A 288 TaxID=1962181 RepID=UPI000B4C1492|nr:hypothetical protein [Ideonella sp. A 288]
MGTYNTKGVLLESPAVSSGKAGDANAQVKAADTQIEAIDALQMLLDVVGLIPGAGAPADLLNGIISAARGDFIGAGLSLFGVVPIAGEAATVAKIAKNSEKYLQALDVVAKKVVPHLPASVGRKVEDAIAQARNKIDEIAGNKPPAAASKSTPDDAPKAKNEGTDGGKIKGKKSVEKGKCGEFLARMDMAQDGFDEIVSVQNNSGHGVDLIGRNSKTGEVKVWEVKTTETAKAPPLSKDQATLGGEKFTNNRLDRAARGQGNYGKVPEAIDNAEKTIEWIKRAKNRNAPVLYEKREVFVDDLDKGCVKHPSRPSHSKPWSAK